MKGKSSASIVIDGKQILKDRVQNDIYKMTDQLKNIKSINRAYKILRNLKEHEEIISMNNLEIEYPREYEFEMNKFQKEYDKYIDSMNYYYQYLSYNRLLYTHHRLCSAIGKIPKYCELGYIYKCKNRISLDETTDLAADFLIDYDPIIAKFFFDLIDNKKIYYAYDKNSCGTTFDMSEKNDLYVFVSPSKTIGDAFTLVHETMHAYTDECYKTMNDAENANTFIVNFMEVYSIFIELVFGKYLKDNKICEVDVYNYIKEYFMAIVDQMKEFKESNYYDAFSERYVYGFVLAFHFYNQYLVNPEKAKKNIKNFALDTKCRDKVEMLNDYGLNIENIQNEKKLQRYVKRYINRLEK